MVEKVKLCVRDFLGTQSQRAHVVESPENTPETEHLPNSVSKVSMQSNITEVPGQHLERSALDRREGEHPTGR